MARRDVGRAEMRSDEVRFSTSSAKNKSKASISTRGRQQVQLAGLYFWRRVGFWGEARKKKN